MLNFFNFVFYQIKYLINTLYTNEYFIDILVFGYDNLCQNFDMTFLFIFLVSELWQGTVLISFFYTE